MIAATGHRLLSVRPRKMDTPFLKGSVFDALMSTFKTVGFSLELICTSTSLTVKWADGS